VRRRLRLAVIGLGRLGRACAQAILDDPEIDLAGIVRRGTSVAASVPDRLARFPIAGHLRELSDVHAALICVPTGDVLGVAREALQERIPIVECAQLTGPALQAHWQALQAAAELHRTKAVVGAGWEPGLFALFEQAFALLIPKGENHVSRRPGTSLHHTVAVQRVAGVAAALTSEYAAANGTRQRYVYVECSPGADVERIKRELASDPLFAGEETLVFPVESIAALEQAGHGVVFERRGTAGTAAHDTLLLEGRFDAIAFAARVMLDGARSLAWLKSGAHPYRLTPPLALRAGDRK
jgi:diaminopimelate dehydrogenase